MLRVTGIFQPVPLGDPYEPARTDRPFMPFHVEYDTGKERRRHEVLFLVDTGADATVLEPRDSYALLGDELFDIDFDNDPWRRTGVGVGGTARSVTRLARLSTMSDSGLYLGITDPICIAEPVPRVPSGERAGNWDAPSLLGRDILRFFEIHLDYFPRPHIELWFDETAARAYRNEDDRRRAELRRRDRST